MAGQSVSVSNTSIRGSSCSKTLHKNHDQSTTTTTRTRDTIMLLSRRYMRTRPQQGASISAWPDIAGTSKKLGFMMSEKKCIWIQTQEQTFLGFVIDSRRMEVLLTQGEDSQDKERRQEPIELPDNDGEKVSSYSRSTPINSSSHISSETSHMADIDTGAPRAAQPPEYQEIMRLEDDDTRTDEEVSTLMVRRNGGLERSELSPLHASTRSVHRRFGLRLGDCVEQPHIVWAMATSTSDPSHQLEGVDGHLESDAATSPTRVVHPDLLRQHDHDRLHQQIWGDTISPPDGAGSPDLEFLPADEHEDHTNLCTINVSTQPTPLLVSSLNRWNGECPRRSSATWTINGDLTRWTCLLTGTTTCCPGTSLGNQILKQWQDTLQMSWQHLGRLYICPPWNLLPLIVQRLQREQVAATRGGRQLSGSRPSQVRASPRRSHHKRPERESALVADCMEHKLQRIEANGADATTAEIIMRVDPKRYLRYAQTQASYKAWCRKREVDHMDPSGASIVNFLTYGRGHFQW
ncbi:hypothetical protein BGW37DRAFT_290511 [Umbelopsis sp. PMI_123]|nr:hypothetical protein BGW37DRAFT_290511 [Umbelopsis sp. PMI_123]